MVKNFTNYIEARPSLFSLVGKDLYQLTKSLSQAHFLQFNVRECVSVRVRECVSESAIKLDRRASNPHGGKAVSAGASQRYIAVIKLPKAMNLSPLFKEIQFEWTVDQKNKTIVLEWFRLVSW